MLKSQSNYIVLFEDSKALGFKSKYVIAFLTFIDSHDENRRLCVKANTEGFDGISAGEIKDYFHVNTNCSFGDFFKNLYSKLNNEMPTDYVPPIDEHVKHLAIIQLGIRDKEKNPNAIYCHYLKRNPVVNGKQHRRSSFNSDKIKLIRESLFDLIKDDNTISCCFSDDLKDSRTNVELLNDLNIR